MKSYIRILLESAAIALSITLGISLIWMMLERYMDGRIETSQVDNIITLLIYMLSFGYVKNKLLIEEIYKITTFYKNEDPSNKNQL